MVSAEQRLDVIFFLKDTVFQIPSKMTLTSIFKKVIQTLLELQNLNGKDIYCK